MKPCDYFDKHPFPIDVFNPLSKEDFIKRKPCVPWPGPPGPPGPKGDKGDPGGFPVLDDEGKIPDSNLPDSASSPFKGSFADESALIAGVEEPTLGDYA